MPKHHPVFAAIFAVLISQNSNAVTLTSGQTDYVTGGNITISGIGISSALVGTSLSLNKIKNLHIITTGNSGATSSAYGIRTTGNYNQITNDVGAEINTSGSSGRGISIANLSIAINAGNISTLGTSSYGIYLGGDNNSALNSGNITTAQSYGIYLDGNVNQVTNSGNITTTGGTSAYGIYISAGSDLAATESSYSTVENSGNINSHDHGIYNKDHFAHITNSGIITPFDDAEINGIRNEGDEVVINNSGTINSTRYAIYSTGQEVIINNSGTLNGSEIRLGNSTLNILGGSIRGIINGNDEARVNIGSSLVNIDYTQENIFEDLAILTINSGSSFTANNEIETQVIFVAEDGNLNLHNGFESSAAIKGLSNGAGNVNLSGIDFSGALGASGNNLENINIAANTTFTSSGDIFSDNISTAGILNFASGDNLTIHGNLTVNSLGNFNITNQSQMISGNFSVAANGILTTNLSNNQIGNLDIGGNTIIADGAKLSLNFANNDYIANGTRFTILSSYGSNNITEIATQNISVNNNSSNIYGLLRFTTIATSNNLYLEANHLSATEISDDKNVQNIYSALGEIGDNSTGKLREFQSYLDNANLSSDKLDLTIKQLAAHSSKTSLVTTSAIVNNSIKIDEKRLLQNHFNQKMNNGFWVETFGNSLAQNAVKDDDGFSANSIGLVFGLDKESSENNLIGASLSYVRSDVKSADDSKSNLISTYQISIFNGHTFDQYFLDLIGSFALHQYSGNRSISAVNSSASARYNGQSFAAKIKGGKIMDLPYELKLIPEFSLNFMHSKIAGYSENGADSLNLKVEAIAANSLETRAGINFGFITRIPDLNEFKRFVLLAKASVGQNIINDKPVTTAKFMNSDVTFDSRISQLDATSLRLGFEIDAAHIDDISFGFEYALEKRKSLQSHFVIAKVKQAF
jgi:uncharacterized protein with beta-barrel porin domain